VKLKAIATALVGASVATFSCAEFAFVVSPPRFELSAKPGERKRQVLEISNTASSSSALMLRTADWALGEGESVVFYEDLQPGSCRPWVAIERRELTVGPRQSYRYRFEVTPPADQSPVECRFALMLEGKEPTLAGPGGVIPIAARMAVIVYLAVGDVSPQLRVVGSRVLTRNGIPTAVIEVGNSGTATGRLDGFLSGRDSRGTSVEAIPANVPILPGETRQVPLDIRRTGRPKEVFAPVFPIHIQGKLEWGDRRTTSVELRYDQ
jgi:hypothetical protein